MATTTLKEDIVTSLTAYITDDDVNATLLGVLADRALDAFEEYRNYPSHWTAEQILADKTKNKSCICDLALFEYVQQGAEFQSMHIESGLYRMWHNKGNVFTQHRIVPFATV